MLEPKTTNRRRAGKSPRGGRPRTADLEKLSQNILDAAGELFLQHGYDGTSMDAIAEKARISKRTLYARHADKSALFNAAIYDLLGRFLVRIETIEYGPGDLETILLAVARDMVTSVTRPEFLAVYRLVTFEAQRRPDFGRWINETRRRPAVQTIATILQRYADELQFKDFARAAEQFMNVTVDVYLLYGTLGIKSSPREAEDRLKSAIDLFLKGVRRRDTREEESSRRRKTAGKK